MRSSTNALKRLQALKQPLAVEHSTVTSVSSEISASHEHSSGRVLPSMATTTESSNLPSPARRTLREFLEICAAVDDGHTPSALQLEARADDDAAEALALARSRFHQSSQSFFEPCFQESVLENLTREDPVAPPTLEHDLPDQGDAVKRARDSMRGALERLRSEQALLRTSSSRARARARQLEEGVADLSLQAEAASDAGLAVLDKDYTDSRGDDGNGSDNDGSPGRRDRDLTKALTDQDELISAAEAERAELAAQVASLRQSLAADGAELLALQAEQERGSAAAATEDALRKAETARDMEKMVGVTDMTSAQLNAALTDERALVRRNSGIRAWYTSTVANLELITGTRVSHRLLFGTEAGDAGVGGLQLLVSLGTDQVMEVTVSSVDGSIRSAELCDAGEGGSGGGSGGGAKSAGVLSLTDVAELRGVADSLPPPGNVRMLVREAINRARCANLREGHVKMMRKRYLVGSRAAGREVTVTMPVGIVASFALHPEYPMVAGGAEISALAGVGGWSASETEQLRRQVNHLALPTMMAAMDTLEQAVAALEARRG